MSNRVFAIGVIIIVCVFVAVTTWFCLLAYAAEHICP